MVFNSPGKGSLFISMIAAAWLGLGSGMAQAKGIRLQYSDRVGETVRYRMVMDSGASEFAGGETKKSILRSEMVVAQEVVSKENGLARVKTRVDSATLNADGEDVPVPAVGAEVTADMKATGEVVRADTFAGLDLKNMQVVFPDKEVDVNESWTVTLAPAPGMPVALHVTYTVAGIEQLGGEEVVKIRASVVSDKSLPTDGFAVEVKSEGEMYFNPRLGRMVRNEMRSRSALIRTAGLSMDKSVTRISNRIRTETIP